MEEENPWFALVCENGNYYLEVDLPMIVSNNESYNNTTHPKYVNLQYIPEPFLGNPAAPIYLLLANPGRANVNEAQALHNMQEEHVNTAINNLTHVLNEEYPLYYLNPAFENIGGFAWWNRCISPLAALPGITMEILASNIFTVEIYGYHTYDFNKRFISNILRLPSVEYNLQQVRNAIAENKIILISRSVANWFALVPELQNYDNCFFVANNRAMTLSKHTLPPLAIQSILDCVG